MRIQYNSVKLEKTTIAFNVVFCSGVVATFVMLFGFTNTVVSAGTLFALQKLLLAAFVLEKIVRYINAHSKREWLRGNWYEFTLLLLLGIVLVGGPRWYANLNVTQFTHACIGVYLVLQVIIKVCRTAVNMAATGRNAAKTLIVSFVVLIFCGAGMLMLPKSTTSGEGLSFIDSLFTATSATCVTGLIVKDTGQDFTLMGQLVILTLIQLGGLGIVIFGAVIALLLGQALGVRGSVAMQDLLNAGTVSKIGKMIAFIFMGTLIIEAAGAISMYPMWDDVPGRVGSEVEQWYCSVFHSISAFCNAGFSLFPDSMTAYRSSYGIFGAMSLLIILGGLGFGVLYDLTSMAGDRIKRIYMRLRYPQQRLYMQPLQHMQLQTKIVLVTSFFLIVTGMIAIMFFEHFTRTDPALADCSWREALFQSITARTAGFNTIDIGAMSASSRTILIILMFIGGSPGSTAGGIKTVTFAVVAITVLATLRKRSEVEMFRRSIRLAIIGRAITVMMVFVVVLTTATLLLSVTERCNHFASDQIFFEAASALGTVGLSTGITDELTSMGKLIIVLTMLIGRLGPLTLLTTLTFDLKPVNFNYPDEAVVVG